MNNMKSKDQNPKLRNLSLSIGQFIRHWGFRRIHGAIWTQLYVSNTPLSCTDLTVRLGLSKALISPALEELCKYKLIHDVPASNEKTKNYAAATNTSEVIQNVLKTREAKILKQITDDFSKFNASSKKSDFVDQNKVNHLGEMIFSANIMLEMLVSQRNIMQLPIELGE